MMKALPSFSDLHSQLRINFLKDYCYIYNYTGTPWQGTDLPERNPESPPEGNSAAAVHVDTVYHTGISNIRNCHKILYS